MSDNKPIKTLAQARTRIQELEARLAGKPTPIKAGPALPSKSTAKATVKDFVASVKDLTKKTGASSVEAIVANLEAGGSSMEALEHAEKALSAIIKTERNINGSSKAFRALAKVQKQKAAALIGDAKAWKRKYWGSI